MAATTISLDGRGRAPLGKLTEHRLFDVVVEESGRIVLDPVIVVNARSLQESNPDLFAELTAALPGPGSVRPRPARSGASRARQDGGVSAPSVGQERVRS